MCPLVKEFQKHPKEFETIVCVTGQHREMLDQVLRIFEVVPDLDLNIIALDIIYCSGKADTILKSKDSVVL